MPNAIDRQQAITDKCFHHTGTFIEFEKASIEQSIPERFEQQAQRYPNRLAVKSKNHTLTYAQLNRTANRIARAILDRWGEDSTPVALFFEHDAPMIAAILGVLKAGKIYVPLDSSYPKARLEFVLENSQAALVLTNNRHLDFINTLITAQHQVLNIDQLKTTLGANNIGMSLSPGSPIHILYTSGSTGTPKGVVQNHRNRLHDVMIHANGLHISTDDRLALLYSCCTGMGATVMFSTLLNGAALLPFDIKTEGMAALPHWMVQEKITIYTSITSVLRQFFDALKDDSVPGDLRVIYQSGEPLYQQDVVRFKKRFPRTCVLVNGMGAGETARLRRFFIDHDTPITNGVVPVGYPVEDKEIILLDDSGQPVEPGQIGEMAIKSRYLSPGYWQRPDLTRAAFRHESEEKDERTYLTGDLGQMSYDGCLMHRGRLDFQVKIRGNRVEIAEIEALLSRQESVKAALVVARDDGQGNRCLIAYVVPQSSTDPDVSTLRRQIAEVLPEYMVPSMFIFLAALPRLPNGKVDRRSLPLPSTKRPALSTVFVAPRTLTELTLQNFLRDLLKVDTVGVHDNFFDLGGHSLMLTQLAIYIQIQFNVDIPLWQVFKSLSIERMARLIEAKQSSGETAAFPPVSRIPRKERLPLSFAQQRLWILDRLEPGSPVNNISVSYRLCGQLDEDALEKTINYLIRRHESMRTVFHHLRGVAYQTVQPHTRYKIGKISFPGIAKQKRRQSADAILRDEALKPFHLSSGPLFRIILMKLAANDHLFTLSMHHIISDGWSKGLFIRELSHCYRAFLKGGHPALPELPVQYIDYAVSQRKWFKGSVFRQQLAYWKQQLEDAPPGAELPVDFERSETRTFRGARESIAFSQTLRDALKALSRRHGATLFMTLLTAFKALLHRYTAVTDVVVGIPVANRYRQEIAGLIGFFVNTLVLRTNLSGNPLFTELLKQVKKMAMAAYANQDLPFEKLVETLSPDRDLIRPPFFNLFFNMLNVEIPDLALHNLHCEPYPQGTAIARYDLTLYVNEARDEISAVYNADLFETKTIRHFLWQYLHLLNQITHHPERHINAYSLVTRQAEQVLPDPEAVIHAPLHKPVTAVFAEIAKHSSTKTALCQGVHHWSYAELLQRSDCIACGLIAAGLRTGDVVGLYGDRGGEWIAGLLGILRAGGIIMPIDPVLTEHRKRLMVVESSAQKLLYTGKGCFSENWTNDLPKVDILSTDKINGSGTLPEISPNDPAYIFFTSGTTGIPDGILGVHRSLSHFINWQRTEFAIGESDRVAQLTSPSFDMVLRDIFLPLTSGARLCLPENESGCSGEQVFQWLEKEQITVIHTVPSLARSWLKDLKGPTPLNHLRWVFFAGEALSASLVQQWRQEISAKCRIINLYGPTETTMVKCYYALPEGPLPSHQFIGYPMPQTQVLILKGDHGLCGVNELGEIALRTPFRTLGYINNPDANQARFIKNPLGDDDADRLFLTGDLGRYRPDGLLEFIGRTDDQIKIRGVRIELNEIMQALSRHKAVAACYVAASKNTADEYELIAYVVKQDPSVTVHQLREYLIGRLPAVMVPRGIVFLDRLPLTANGKIDRRALPEADTAVAVCRQAYVAPRTEMEKVLVDIWSDILKIERVGMQDNFFDLGGHSLLAMQVKSRIYQSLGIDIPLRMLFEAPTIAKFIRAYVEYQEQQGAVKGLEKLLAEIEAMADD